MQSRPGYPHGGGNDLCAGNYGDSITPFIPGEDEAVALAIYEHYLPALCRGRSFRPAGRGLLVGIADRLDSLAGLFAAGLAPSGTKDPFAQRRAALGLVQSLVGWEDGF